MHIQPFRPLHRFIRWLVALPLLLAIVPTSAQPLPTTPSLQALAASDSQNGHLSLVQRLGGGAVSEIKVDGARAFVGDGRGLSLLDISQPAQPVLISRQPLYENVENIDVEGDLVYVTEQRGRLQIVDFSTPTQPVLRSTYIPPVPDQYTPLGVYGVSVVGNRAYLAAYGSGLLILDVTNPGNPQLLGQYAATKYARDVQVVGSLAYIGERGRSMLSVIDLTNPSQPTLVDELEVPRSIDQIQIAGQFAYLSMGGIVQIVDLSDPSHLVTRGSFTSQYYTSDLAIVGNLAYAADTNGSFSIVNIANPDQPVLVKTYKNWRQVWSVEVTHTLARIAVDDRMITLDVGDPQNVQEIGTYVSKGYTVVDAVGDRLYVVTTAGFEILDVQNPAQPVLLGTYPGRVLNAVVKNGIGYLNLADGFHIVDLYDPANLRKLGGYTGPARIAQVADGIGYGYEVRLAGEYRYESDLQIFDLRDATNPRLLGKTTYDDRIADLWVVGQHVYMAVERLGLAMVDVSDPAHPVQQGRGVTGHSLDITVASGRAYVADYLHGLQIVDVRDPMRPQLVSKFEGEPDYILDARKVTLNGPWAYILNTHANFSPGLWVINTLDPAHPTLWDYYEVPAPADAITVDGDTVYLSSDGELYILRINDYVMQPQLHLPIMSMSQN